MFAEETRNVDPIRITLIATVVVMTLLGMGFVIAIMRQRNAVNAVVNAHGRLMDALENAAHGVALFDFDNGLLHINARFASLHPGEICELQSGLSFHAVASVLNRAPPRNAAATGWQALEQVAPRTALGPILVKLRDGRCVQADLRTTAEGGTALVHSDVTKWCRVTARLSQRMIRSLNYQPARILKAVWHRR